MRVPAALRRLAGSRLAQFAVLGGVLFAVAPRPVADRDIHLDPGVVRSLQEAEARRLGVPALPDARAREVTDRLVEDEVLYREALRLGLDRSDPVVRQRLIQKTLFLAQTLGGAGRAPTEAELRAFFDEDPGRFRRGGALRFLHVYAGQREAVAALRDPAIAAERAHPGVAPPLGETFPYSRTVPLTPIAGVERDFGADFARALEQSPDGAWSEPIASRFGWHLVKVLERREGGVPRFEEVRDEVQVIYVEQRKQDAASQFLRRTLERYRVELGDEPYVLPAGAAVRPPGSEDVGD